MPEPRIFCHHYRTRSMKIYQLNQVIVKRNEKSDHDDSSDDETDDEEDKTNDDDDETDEEEDGTDDDNDEIDEEEDETDDEEDKEEEGSNDEKDNEEDDKEEPAKTKSGRRSSAPNGLSKTCDFGGGGMLQATIKYDDQLTEAEKQYYSTMNEICNVGAALGGGFTHTSELGPMKYKEVMAGAEKGGWKKKIGEEYERMVKYGVWREVPKICLPDGAKIMSTTWLMKKKWNGTKRAGINARGYKQKDGQHYTSHSISAPVTNDVTIRIMLVLMIMGGWIGELVDVKGAFLHGDFTDGEEIYIETPERFEPWIEPEHVLLLLETIYGLKQAAMAFWRKLLQAFRYMKLEQSRTDPCLYFKWTEHGLTVTISWVDNCLIMGPTKGVTEVKQKFLDSFDCKEIGNMDEYIRCQLTRIWDE